MTLIYKLTVYPVILFQCSVEKGCIIAQLSAFLKNTSEPFMIGKSRGSGLGFSGPVSLLTDQARVGNFPFLLKVSTRHQVDLHKSMLVFNLVKYNVLDSGGSGGGEKTRLSRHQPLRNGCVFPLFYISVACVQPEGQGGNKWNGTVTHIIIN